LHETLLVGVSFAYLALVCVVKLPSLPPQDIAMQALRSWLKPKEKPASESSAVGGGGHDISLFGSACLMSNNVCGSAMVQIPGLFQVGVTTHLIDNPRKQLAVKPPAERGLASCNHHIHNHQRVEHGFRPVSVRDWLRLTCKL
jgi:hypothetical protein